MTDKDPHWIEHAHLDKGRIAPRDAYAGRQGHQREAASRGGAFEERHRAEIGRASRDAQASPQIGGCDTRSITENTFEGDAR